jgi:tRNA A-37 threonylcarbamoyl transferase component Bud32
MAYLTEKKIVHGELNLKSVLIQNKRQVFVADYGFSKVFTQPDGSRVYSDVNKFTSCDVYCYFRILGNIYRLSAFLATTKLV